jgi:Flp pilus assembly protein TadD
MTKTRNSSEVDAEDFLYHLYRGSESLSEGRLDLARDSLEMALRMQPRDPSAQDLLGKLYFKLGVYPRAIELYQEIVRQYPDSLPPRINLALAYLKTAQLRDAVAHLLPVIERDPTHTRAWGYLGLCWSRLSEFAKAREAFLRAGHDGMARRMEEALEAQYGSGSSTFIPTHPAPPGDAAPIREPDEIDTGVLEPGHVQLASDTPSAPGRWVTRAPGEQLRDGRVAPSTLSAWSSERVFVAEGRTVELVDGMLVAYEGCAIRCETDVFGVGFTRGPSVRSRDGDAFEGSPGLHWVGDGWCALPPRAGYERTLLALRDEALWVLERHVLGFDGGLHLDHAIVAGTLRAASFVGRGVVAFEARGDIRILRIQGEEAVVAPELLVAWSPGVTPGERDGAVSLVGDGVVAIRTERATATNTDSRIDR